MNDSVSKLQAPFCKACGERVRCQCEDAVPTLTQPKKHVVSDAGNTPDEGHPKEQAQKPDIATQPPPCPKTTTPKALPKLPAHGMSLIRLRNVAAEIAQEFHETYERLAPEFGYDTRKDSAVPWDEVPTANRSLMVAVVIDLLATGVIRNA